MLELLAEDPSAAATPLWPLLLIAGLLLAAVILLGGLVLNVNQMLKRLTARYGEITPLNEASSAPADRFALPDGTVFGIIASTTQPFCAQCDRSRVTADGMWYLCLYATRGVDLRAAIRRGASAEELREIVTRGWLKRQDRGAETRLALGDRRAFVPITALKENPHLEMHTRGG